MRKIPKVVWLVVDLEPGPRDPFVETYMTRREAREQCNRLNRIPGYDPTCRVVRYNAAPSVRKEGRSP